MTPNEQRSDVLRKTEPGCPNHHESRCPISGAFFLRQMWESTDLGRRFGGLPIFDFVKDGAPSLT